MKIDLRKDRGVLKQETFQTIHAVKPEISEEERIAETLRRRHSTHEPENSLVSENIPDAKKQKEKSKRNPLREFAILIAMLVVVGYYLHEQTFFDPTVSIVKGYWMDVMGIQDDSPESELTTSIDAPQDEGVLSDELFDELMPVTPDIAALADSIAIVSPDSMYAEQAIGSDTTDSSQAYLPVAAEPIQLSDDDIIILNNRSLLLMLTEIVGVLPEGMSSAHLFLKRDALRMTAPQAGKWVAQMKSVLDKFVMGNFVENYSAGNIKISSKYEIIMNAEQDFQAQILDEMKLLDVLAHPFDDYLKQIVIDLAKGIDDNPAKFTFAGNPQEIQYILSSWAETRTNMLLKSVDIKFDNNQLTLTFEVTFFTYSP